MMLEQSTVCLCLACWLKRNRKKYLCCAPFIWNSSQRQVRIAAISSAAQTSLCPWGPFKTIEISLKSCNENFPYVVPVHLDFGAWKVQTQPARTGKTTLSESDDDRGVVFRRSLQRLLNTTDNRKSWLNNFVLNWYCNRSRRFITIANI